MSDKRDKAIDLRTRHIALRSRQIGKSEAVRVHLANKLRTHTTAETPTLKNFEGGGVADYKCNKCGQVVERDLGMRTWVKSLCGTTGKWSRLYRISGIKKGTTK